MDYETLRNSMTVQDAARVLRDTKCYGTMDIAKSVILKALDEKVSSSEKPNKWINKPQESEDEKIIRIKKGTLKARTGRYVIYDVEWLKTHFNTTEAKIYGQPQPSERTEEGTETHACDYISRKAVLEITAETGALETQTRVKALPPANPQQKTGHWIEHKHGGIEHIECSECGIWFLKADLSRKSYCPNCGSCNGDMIKNIMRDITKK